MIFRSLFLLLAIAGSTFALYDSNDAVIELTESNFESRIKNSDDVWIVEFYAPWCGHCKNLVPEYKKAAKALKGIVKMGAIDGDQHRSVGQTFGVRGFPTIKIFGANKAKPQDYNGGRTAQAFIDAAFKELRAVADARIGAKSSSGGGSSKKGDVIVLTDDNFKKQVLDSEDLWLVEFYAPWCGHCKNLEPIWAEAATALKGKVKIAALDATVHSEMANKYNVRGFPTIKVFNAGKKDGSAEDYQGGRTKQDIVNFALEKAAENLPAPEIVEITKAGQIEKDCKDAQLCVISVLPHILDCQSKCRNEYLTMLKEVGEKYKKNRWTYLWAEAGAQLDMEQSLDLGGFGYPAMVALNPRKMKFSPLRGSFGLAGVSEFLRDLTYGRGSSQPMKGDKLPTVVDSTAWNGKDGELPVVDDIDLSDVELDPLPSAKSEL